MSIRFVYMLRGGPYNGREIIGTNQTWRAELYHFDPYSPHATAAAVYGSRHLQVNASPRLLYYWGSQPADPKTARDPVFYS